MKAKSLSTALAILFLGSIIYAKEPAYKLNRSTSLQEQIKFGAHYGINFFSSSWGIFGEYKPNESLGLQIAISYFKNFYTLLGTEVSNGGAAMAETNYISLPFILRSYPGNDRQFCLFAGAKLGYILKGNFLFTPGKEITKEDAEKLVKDIESNKLVISLKDINEQDKINRFQLGFTLGLDYEFKFGLILGLSFTKELINVIKSKNSFLNWTLQPTLSYNFGKFL